MCSLCASKIVQCESTCKSSSMIRLIVRKSDLSQAKWANRIVAGLHSGAATVWAAVALLHLAQLNGSHGQEGLERPFLLPIPYDLLVPFGVSEGWHGGAFDKHLINFHLVSH
jgi:hypothetical protein